uniref:Uncharacterized protein n=1 Tax=Arundo donax TaxID=35708 RepID=A0A0A9BT36_ARUDO
MAGKSEGMQCRFLPLCELTCTA